METPEVTEEELKALEYAAAGIRLTARIVDTPCNEMNVDYFLQVLTCHLFSYMDFSKL